MTPAALNTALCKTFCGDLAVHEVPGGVAISAMFEGSDGDRLSLLAEKKDAGWRLSDDGSFLGDLHAWGVDVLKGGRGEFLERALSPAHARIIPETLQIVADVPGDLQPRAILNFLTSLYRAQDISFWTKERIRSTFRDDAEQALRAALGGFADIDTEHVLEKTFEEFPADVIIRPKETGHGQSVTAVYLASGLDAFQEAMVLAQELRIRNRRDVRVALLIESDQIGIGNFRAIRAINRVDAVSYFRRDEAEAAYRIARTAVPGLPVVH